MKIKAILLYLILLHLALLAYTCIQAQTPKQFDIVIHEVFADPSPAVGLPSSEFIELRNVSQTAFSLRSWKITDGSVTATIGVNYILKPDSLVIICPSSAQLSYAQLGPTIGVTGFPSLNNDADMIALISPAGKTVHAVAYNSSWYSNGVKSEGGWTLEMMDAINPCQGEGNWQASRDARGGTPGARNSVEAVNPDKQPPGLIRTYTIDSITIVALFDEPLDSTSAASISNYSFTNDIKCIKALPAQPLFQQVMLGLSAPLAHNTIYKLEVKGITDCAGNSIGLLNTARAGLPSGADKMDVVINEVLFNPRTTGTDYIECYNRSNKVIDASSLLLGNVQRLSEAPWLIFPGDHVVATSDASLVLSEYKADHPPNILVVNQMPSLPDDKGNIVLLNQQGIIIDELSYDEKWHFALLTNREGVSLERIDPHLPTQLQHNWTSAASEAGYGTPTYRNSQAGSSISIHAIIEADPPAFSPDNDGAHDHCFIHYQLEQAGYVANVTIFDIRGNAVRNLCRNATLQQKGFLRWDGIDDAGNKLPVGVYIIISQVFNLQGRRKNFKNPVTLLHRF